MRSYESFGFEGMDTPAMENLQVFLGKGGGENEKLMFRVLKRGAELEHPGAPPALTSGALPSRVRRGTAGRRRLTPSCFR